MRDPSELDDVLPQADFVVLTIPHTPQTEGLFDASKFALMKNTAIFINIGRGMTTKLDDLNDALRNGSHRRCRPRCSMKSSLYPRTIRCGTRPTPSLTPHIAADEGRHLGERRYEVVSDNMRRFAAGEPLRNLVDKQNWF